MTLEEIKKREEIEAKTIDTVLTLLDLYGEYEAWSLIYGCKNESQLQQLIDEFYEQLSREELRQLPNIRADEKADEMPDE